MTSRCLYKWNFVGKFEKYDTLARVGGHMFWVPLKCGCGATAHARVDWLLDLIDADLYKEALKAEEN